MADRRNQTAQDRARTGRQTTDELFNETYNEAGIQPFNVVVDRRPSRPTSSDTTETVEAQRELETIRAYEQSQAAAQRSLNNDAAAPVEISDTNDTTGGSAATKLADRTVFFWMMGWHWWQWITLQLTVGLLSVMFFSIAYSFESTWIGRRISNVASAINTVTSFVGFNFSGYSPENMFLVLYLFLLGIMWLSLFATVVVYMCIQHHALSGKGTGLKYGTLAIALIGYAIPVANLFPWIFAYIWVMARNPK